MNVRLVQQRLDGVLAYLGPSLKFINCHMVDFLTENLWEKFIPVEIRNEIQSCEDVESGVKLFWGDGDPTRYPQLQKFIAETEQFRLENIDGVLLSQNDLFTAIRADLKTEEAPLNIKEFMNEKKNHEVEIVSSLVAKLISRFSTENEVYVLDAGDGKGYLSSRLALEHNLNVLGIDASEINTEGAQKRMKKLQRAWSGLKERTEIINMGLPPPPRRNKKLNSPKPDNNQQSSTSSLYKSVNSYITKETDFDRMVRDNFETSADFTMCLTGLHTCGNLAPTCLDAFANKSRIRLLCNIGCCYHLITEKYSTAEDEYFSNLQLTSKCTTYGFPMSKYLRSKEMKLGRNARMLASQSMHRTKASSTLNTQSLFYRALLQVILRDKYPELNETLKVGKVKKFSTFREYLERCGDKCELKLAELDVDYVDAMLVNFEKTEKLIDLYYLIRMSFAQIVETLILLDRLLFLLENGIERSFLIRLFDPIKSPRCYGLVAFK